MRNVVALRDLYSSEQAFRDADPQVRIAAIQHAAEQLASDGHLHELVVERLKDPDPRVAQYAAVTLARVGDAVGVASLLTAIKTAKGAPQRKELDLCLRQCTRFPTAILSNELIRVESIAHVADGQLRVVLERMLDLPAEQFLGKSPELRKHRERVVRVLTRAHSIKGLQLRDDRVRCTRGVILIPPSADRPGYVCPQPGETLYEFCSESVVNRSFCEVGREVLFVCRRGQSADRCHVIYVLEDVPPRSAEEVEELLAVCRAATFFKTGVELAGDRRWDAAIEAYTNAIRHREEARTYSRRGDAYGKKGDWQRAIEDFTKVLEIDPNNEYAYRWRGRAYVATSEWDRAIADCTRALELDPKNTESLNRRGLAYGNKKDWQRAIEDFTESLGIDPNNEYTYRNRGWAYAATSDWDGAIADSTRALELDPKNTESLNRRGFAYGNKEEWQRAIEDFTKALEIDPNNEYAYRRRGRAYVATSDWDRAIADCTRALELDPKNTVSLNRRGLAYGNKRDWQRAIEDFTKALEIDPNNEYACRTRGWVYGEISEWDRAIADYTRALGLDPQNTMSLNNRGLAYGNKKDWQRAIEDLEHALRIDPSNRTARENLEWPRNLMAVFERLLGDDPRGHIPNGRPKEASQKTEFRRQGL